MSLIQKALGLTLDPDKFKDLKVVKSKNTVSEYDPCSQTAYVKSGDEYPEVMSVVGELEELKDNITPTSIHEVMHPVGNYLRFGDIKRPSELHNPNGDILDSVLTQRMVTQMTLGEFIVNEGFAIYGENMVHNFISNRLISSLEGIDVSGDRLLEYLDSINQKDTSRREGVSVQKCLDFLDFIDNLLFEHKIANKLSIIGDLMRFGMVSARFGLRWEDIVYKCGYLYMDGLTKVAGNNIIDIMKRDIPSIDEIRKVIIESTINE